MKLLTVTKLPAPYEKKIVIVVEDSFDKDSKTINYAKPFVVFDSAIKNVAVGDDVEFLYNRYHKIDQLKKVD